jgi:DNA mismatch repair protein MutS
MEYPKEILVKDYFEIHDYYSKIYGKGRTIILMQVGSFHEAYCTDSNGLDLVNLSQQIDVFCTKKNNNLSLSVGNPRMIGFPIFVTRNFIDKLIDLNYTIVLIDQVSDPPKPERKVTGIFSPATHIENKNTKTTHLVSIVLDKIKDTKTNTLQICIGMSSYDLTTGIGAIFETYSKSDDVLIGLDDAQRFLETYPPREIILENNLKNTDMVANMKVDEILGYLGINPATTYSINICNHKKIAWQKNLFEQIYKIESNVDVIEMLGLQFLNWARLSLVLLLDYVIAHQPRLLEQLSIPEIFSSHKYLYLGNRALDQLDVIQKANQDTCLFKIINFTKTQIGKRYLYMQLTMPLIDSVELNKRYDTINMIINNNHKDNIVKYLEDIYDLDKLIRKLEINMIHPGELYQLYISFYQINKLFLYFKENDLTKIFGIRSKLIKQIDELILWIENKFAIEKINGLNFNGFFESENSFYLKENHKDIDDLQDKINITQNFMHYLIKALDVYVDDKVYFKKSDTEKTEKTEKSLISLKFNERDGHYLLLTNRRCAILKKNLAKEKTIAIGSIILNISDLEFTELPKSLNTKISSPKIQDLSKDLVILKQALAKKLKDVFKEDMKIFSELYVNILHTCTKKIAYIDFINSGAICAISNHYVKPIINEKQSSFFKAKEMRHPIIEKISTSTTYRPHDIELGYETNQDGILLYGINSSGKSTLMKSIGLNIILAQIGYYTACTNFEYSPYTSLFTRISGNDNMFRALSAFMVEMTELMAILKRNDNKSLIIGDEICRGTEEKSANIIVCYMLETLAKSSSSFITATHLHQIALMDSVTSLARVKSKHLKISYDQINDTLIYDRHLSDGPGETFYGLQVAKFLMKDKNFNERTNEILKEYDDIHVNTQSRLCSLQNVQNVQNLQNLHKLSTSKYNSLVYLNCCEICKVTTQLETHHIVWQKDFNDANINNNKFYLQKNDSANLVTLCTKCHDKVDKNEIIVNGWINTSDGRKFDYEIIESPVKKSKYSEELIRFVKSIKSKVKSDDKIAIIQIKEKYNKKLTSKMVHNIWAN